MRKKIFILFIIIPLLLVISFTFFVLQKSNSINKSFMYIKSSAFANDGDIPSKYTCNGENINPPLVFGELPDNTKSLVLIVNDPDAPSGTWTHWILWNISSTTTEIKENSIPDGAIEGKNDFNVSTYRGPCPPSGVHRYMFKLIALDTLIDLAPGSDLKTLHSIISSHIISQAQLKGRYQQ